MAEAFAAIGAVAALGQLAGYGDRLVEVLRRYIRHARYAMRDVEGFANDVQSMSILVKASINSLESHSVKYPESPVLAYISSHNTVNDIARRALGSLEVAKEQISKLDSGSRWLIVLKWLLNRQSILELQPEIDRARKKLGMLLQILQIELQVTTLETAQMSEEERRSLRKKIQKQRKQMNSYVDTIEELQSQQLCKHCEHVLKIHGSLNQASELSGIDAFTELGRMVATGAILHRRTEPSAQNVPPAPPSTNISTPATSLSSSSAESKEERRQERIVRSRPTSICSEVPRRNVEFTEQFQRWDEAQVIDATNSSDGMTSGYVQTSEGETYPANAMIGRKVDVNIISTRNAEMLGLNLLPVRTKRFERYVLLGAGDNSLRPIIGQVEFDWVKSSSTALTGQYPPLKICCEVFEHPESLLILGKSFVDERRHYWQD